MRLRRISDAAKPAKVETPPPVKYAEIVVRERRRPTALVERDGAPPASRIPDPPEPAQSFKQPAKLKKKSGGKNASRTAPKPGPSGDYEVGYGKPPTHSRFQKGCKGGPGRPTGVRSHDTILREQLEKQRMIRIDGEERRLAQREIIIAQRTKAALEGKKAESDYMLKEHARLYPERIDTGAANEGDAPSLSETDQEILNLFRASLMEELEQPHFVSSEDSSQN